MTTTDAPRPAGRFTPKAAPTPAPADTRPASFSFVERATRYTVGDPDAAALAALGLTADTLKALSNVAHRMPIEPSLLTGVEGLFSGSVSLPDADETERRGMRAQGATLYLSPVSSHVLGGPYATFPTDDLDLSNRGEEWDPRAVRVPGITQGNAGFRVNGKAYTGTLEVRTFGDGTRYVYAPSSGLTDAARRTVDAAADALASAYLTPDTLAAAAVTLTVSTLQHATRGAMRADAIRADAHARAVAALAAV